MQLFGRTAGYYLFWSGAIYLIGGMTILATDWRQYSGYIAPVWIFILMLPFIIPPFGRWFNLNVTWDQEMFNWFKGKKTHEQPSNVVPFPEPKAVPKMPEVKPPKEEKPATTYYRLGLTSDNRVSFNMGYSEITMNADGVNNMIKQLEVFRDQLQEADEE